MSLLLFEDAHSAAIRVGWSLGRHVGITFDFVEHVLYRGVKLWIAPVDHERGVVDNLDIRVDAVSFHGECAVGLVKRDERYRQSCSVDQRGISGDADYAAPGTHADEFSQTGLAEKIREYVPARARFAVGL